jgi:preprotein translocase subunit SecY
MNWQSIFQFLPEVTEPSEKKVSFKVKLTWTIIILASFFVLANIPLYGLSRNALERFEFLAIILGTDFGSIISLGIGPIVTASIILQLLVGSKILDIDTSNSEGRRFFQGLQKLLVIIFIIFEAIVYVVMQGLQALPGFSLIVIFQLILGGLAIFLMDEVSQKWGFGSGVSMFIAAGVSWRLIVTSLQFVDQQGRNCLLDFGSTACTGRILVFIQSLINRAPIEAISAFAAIAVTVLIFLAVVWAQSLKIEIPLSMGRYLFRGNAMKYPLQFFYAGVIPVILVAALIANISLFGALIENTSQPCLSGGVGDCTTLPKIASYFTWMGSFVNGQPISGLAFWFGNTNLLELAIRGGLTTRYIIQGITHILLFSLLSIVFAVFWVKTSGSDAKNLARKIMNSGMQVSGFRQDERVLEAILERYVMPLTVMGGIAIGLLASFTDLLGALVSGTSILLVIMVMYQFYQNIAQQHAMDMHPALKKFMG